MDISQEQASNKHTHHNKIELRAQNVDMIVLRSMIDTKRTAYAMT